jgi:HK97 gp10 family phage protein
MAVNFIVVYNKIPMLIAAVEAQSRSYPKKVADAIAADARAYAPVATGALRSSISSATVKAGKEAEVVVGAEHGVYVEYGTYKMAAQPFLAPAVANHQEEFFDIFKGTFRGA